MTPLERPFCTGCLSRGPSARGHCVLEVWPMEGCQITLEVWMFFFYSFLLCVFCFSPVWMLQPVNEPRCAMQGRLRCDCRTWCVRWLVPVPYLRHHLMHSWSKRTMYHLHRHLICMIQEVYHKYLSMPIPASVWDKSNRGSLMFFAYGIFSYFY